MRHKSDDITSPPGEVGFGWNEIQFLEADELRRMAPPIVGLEIRRLTDVCTHLEPGSKLYNGIVGARFELRRFVESLRGTDELGAENFAPLPGDQPEAEQDTAPHSGLSEARTAQVRHLESALIYLGLCEKEAEGSVLEVVEYTRDRMSHIHERMNLLY